MMNEFLEIESRYTTAELERKNYVERFLRNSKKLLSEMEEGSEDLVTLELHNLMTAALDCSQFENPHDDPDDVKRLVKVRVNRSKKELDTYGESIKLFPLYGVGLYALMDGLMVTSSSRDRSGYDRVTKRGVEFDLSFLFSKEILDEHELSLAVPCTNGGLFVPKKSCLTDLLRGTFDLSYFDLTSGY